MIQMKADFRPMTRKLDDLAKKQIPFATAAALTKTAKAAAGSTRKELPSIFDKPTPFTMNSIAIQPATKNHLEARVFVKTQQAEYLGPQEEGGVRKPKKAALLIPQKAKLNSYGNLPRKALATLKARKDVFQGQVKGIGGFWQRPERGKRRDGSYGTIGALNRENGFLTGLKLLISFASKAAYKPRFRFKDRTMKTAQTVAPAEFKKALEQALKTVRR
ncbi:hypothetical protein IBL26_15240 [Roseomonas aerophila]|uniref:Uncharacterized protein n=1 Tax=Teichococcus aerophilus TaxID=1224513 RepID=A0ABR7RQ08_9PROT|nr:hypothetical protein [Pseudoroseomonas aerophila]MBC9208197.1 hypothetical protein [Pseudoroseomonas aerophila]